MTSQLLKQVQIKRPRTYDQSTSLFMHCCLLSKLDTDSTMHPEDDHKIYPDLILYDCVSDVLCKFAHSMQVYVIFLVLSRIGSLQNVAQLVFGSFKGSTGALAWASARDALMSALKQD